MTDKLTFLNNISNVLSPPLNDIINAGNDISVINCHTFRLLDIINNITDYYKLVNGQIELYPKPISIKRTLRAVIDMIGIEQSCANICLTVDAAVPRVINTDETRFVQVILNVLANAVKYTGNTASDRVDINIYGNSDSELYIIVQDTGRGIPADVLKTLFDPFNNSTTDQSGIGLGLPIVQEILKLMGGEIWVDSTVGIGTTVHMKMKVDPFNESLSLSDLKLHYAGKLALVTDKARKAIPILHSIGLRTIVSQSKKDSAMHILKNPKIDLVITDEQSVPENIEDVIVPVIIYGTTEMAPITRLGIVYPVTETDSILLALSELSFLKKDDMILRILVTYEPLMKIIKEIESVEAVFSDKLEVINSLLCNGNFDICFIDTSIPGIDPCSINKDTYKVVVTKGKINMNRYYACGVKGYILKPCDRVEVKSLIDRLSLLI
jgi:anti-sigma regulatory factor (Ser/Thr protein kinase)